MATKIQIKRGTKANLPALSPGEFGLTTDTEELYIGGNSGNIRMGKNGESSTPNATAVHSGSVVAITAPAGVNLISFYAPSDFSGDDTYTVNGSAVTLTDLNGNAIYDGWKEGAPVQFILKGTQAFFKAGGGLNGDLPPINPNMSGSLEDGVFTVTADKLSAAQAEDLAGAEWYYGNHIPTRPGDGVKIELAKEQLAEIETEDAGVQTLAATTNLGDETEGSIVTLLESGAPTQFYVSKQNYQNDINGNGRVLLVRKDVYDLRVWAADNIPTYADSDIDAWFNGEYKAKFSSYIQDKMGATKFYYTVGNGNNSVVQLERPVFALSLTELGITIEYANIEGVALPNAEDLKIAYLSGTPQLQWTRSPAISNITNVYRLSKTGTYSTASPNDTSYSRPCFTLPADMQVNPDGSIVEQESLGLSVSIPWASSSYIYVRQFPYNAKHQYQTQLVGAVATNDPDYDSGSIPPEPEDDAYEFLEMLTQTTQWSPSEDGWYSVYCVGKSGDGISGHNLGVYSGSGGAAGGSGGIARSTLYLKTTDVIEITINDSLTSFGDYMSATSGANGTGYGSLYADAEGGTGGTANGGNKENLTGFKGGFGGKGANSVSGTSPSAGGTGENSGAAGGGAANSEKWKCGGGGGGARLPDSKYVIASLSGYRGGNGGISADGGSVYPTTNPPTLYGGGNGGGGGRSGNSNVSSKAAGAGSPGTPGCIIIEKAVAA